MLIVRSALSPQSRLNYLLWLVPPSQSLPIFKDISSSQLIAALVNEEVVLSGGASCQTQVPVKFGGFGLRNPGLVAIAAYVSSVDVAVREGVVEASSFPEYCALSVWLKGALVCLSAGEAVESFEHSSASSQLLGIACADLQILLRSTIGQHSGGRDLMMRCSQYIRNPVPVLCPPPIPPHTSPFPCRFSRFSSPLTPSPRTTPWRLWCGCWCQW